MNPRIEVKVIGEGGYEAAMFGMGLSFGVCSGMDFNDFLNNKVDVQERMSKVFENNAAKDGGHNKFLESMQIWLDVNAPRFWWSEADTYRVGSTKQSESTMHTLVKQLERFGKMMNEERKDGMPHNCTLIDFFAGKESQNEIRKFVENGFDVEVRPAVGEPGFEMRPYKATDCFEETVNIITNLAFSLYYVESPVEKLLMAKRMLPESFMQRRIWNINYKTLRNIFLQRRNHRLPHWNIFLDSIREQLEFPELIAEKITHFGSHKLGGE